MIKHDPKLDVHRRQEKASEFIRKSRRFSSKKDMSRHFQFDYTNDPCCEDRVVAQMDEQKNVLIKEIPDVKVREPVKTMDVKDPLILPAMARIIKNDPEDDGPKDLAAIGVELEPTGATIECWNIFMTVFPKLKQENLQELKNALNVAIAYRQGCEGATTDRSWYVMGECKKHFGAICIEHKLPLMQHFDILVKGNRPSKVVVPGYFYINENTHKYFRNYLDVHSYLYMINSFHYIECVLRHKIYQICRDKRIGCDFGFSERDGHMNVLPFDTIPVVTARSFPLQFGSQSDDEVHAESGNEPVERQVNIRGPVEIKEHSGTAIPGVRHNFHRGFRQHDMSAVTPCMRKMPDAQAMQFMAALVEHYPEVRNNNLDALCDAYGLLCALCGRAITGMEHNVGYDVDFAGPTRTTDKLLARLNYSYDFADLVEGRRPRDHIFPCYTVYNHEAFMIFRPLRTWPEVFSAANYLRQVFLDKIFSVCERTGVSCETGLDSNGMARVNGSRDPTGPRGERPDTATGWTASDTLSDDVVAEMDAGILDRTFGTTTEVVDADTTRNVAEDVSTSATWDLVPLMHTGAVQSIASFLEKPILIDTFVWEKERFAQKHYDLESYLHSKNVWSDKLRGVYGIRGDFVFRLAVNAQPYQQGRLLIVFQPMYADMSHLSGKFSGFNRTENLVIATQLPRVEIDLATQTEATMRVPFRTLASHYNLLTREGSWGRVSILVYAPLRSGQNNKDVVQCSVWLSLESADLAAPIAPVESMKDLIREPFDPPVAQMSDDEKAPGPIEKALGTVEKVAMTAEAIPVIGKYIMPATWAANIGKKVASIFGWSRPLNTERIDRVQITSQQYAPNCDGVENAWNLGLLAENKVTGMGAFGDTSLDEMSIAYIKTRSAFIGDFQWKAPGSQNVGNQVAGTLLFQIPLCPYAMCIMENKVGEFTDDLYGSPLFGLANCFSQWRGSFDLTIKLVKTRFHSGRLAISFLPGSVSEKVAIGGNSMTTDFDNTVYLHRDILDVRDDFIFRKTIPYTAMVPYLNYDQPMGTLLVHVVNPLVAPDIASDVVDVLIEVAGNPDFEFAIPREISWGPRGNAHGRGYSVRDTLPELYRSGAISYVKVHRTQTTEDTVRTVQGAVHYLSSRDAFVTKDFEIRRRSGVEWEDFGPIELATIAIMYADIDSDEEFAALHNDSNSVLVDIKIDETEFDAVMYRFERNGSANQEFVLVFNLEPPDHPFVGPLSLEVNSDQSDVFAEMGDMSSSAFQTIGGALKPGLPGTTFAELCVGEQILSLKQLAMRTVYVSPHSSIGVAKQRFRVAPSNVQGIFGVRTHDDDLILDDNYSYVGSMFAFARGGVILRVVDFSEKGVSHIILEPNTSRVAEKGAPIGARHIATISEKEANNVSAYVPQYGQTVGRLVTLDKSNDVGAKFPFGPSVRCYYRVRASDGNVSTDATFGRAAADDTQFGFFLGIPPLRRKRWFIPDGQTTVPS